ncbi:hypothetical protein KAI46_11685, partial [bacterium]|nr:hypothetical protein [bacterium]
MSADVIRVAADAAKCVLIQAKGNPARIVAAGAAAGITFVGVGLGYGLYRGGEKVWGLVKRD